MSTHLGVTARAKARRPLRTVVAILTATVAGTAGCGGSTTTPAASVTSTGPSTEAPPGTIAGPQPTGPVTLRYSAKEGTTTRLHLHVRTGVDDVTGTENGAQVVGADLLALRKSMGLPEITEDGDLTTTVTHVDPNGTAQITSSGTIALAGIEGVTAMTLTTQSSQHPDGTQQVVSTTVDVQGTSTTTKEAIRKWAEQGGAVASAAGNIFVGTFTVGKPVIKTTRMAFPQDPSITATTVMNTTYLGRDIDGNNVFRTTFRMKPILMGPSQTGDPELSFRGGGHGTTTTVVEPDGNAIFVSGKSAINLTVIGSSKTITTVMGMTTKVTRQP